MRMTFGANRRWRCTGASRIGLPRSAGCGDEGEAVLFVAATPGRAERTIELLKEYDVFAVPGRSRREDAQYAAVLVVTGTLSHGFRLPGAGLFIYAEADVFEGRTSDARNCRRSAAAAFLSDLRDLKAGRPGEMHIDHGIGMFVGLKQIGVSGDSVQEFLELRYAGEGQVVRSRRAVGPRPEVREPRGRHVDRLGRDVRGKSRSQEGHAGHGRKSC